MDRLSRTAMPFGSAEDVFAVDARHPSCHCATVAALPGPGPERLIASWYAGSAECAPDVALFTARWSAAEGWSAPEVLVDTPGRAEGNPVLGLAPSGRLWLIFATLLGRRWTSCRLRRMHSDDGGIHWSEPEDLPGAEVGWLVRNKPLEHGSAWLLPVYDEVAWEGFVLRSEDGGASWTPSGRMRAEGGCIQPSLLPEPDGTLAALLRCGGRGGPVWLSRSADGGDTWSAPIATAVPNPNSGCDGLVRADGSWALVANDLPAGRQVLALRTSDDRGASWPGRGILAEGPGEYSYPAVIPAADGGLHILYTHERTSIRHLRVGAGWRG